MATAVKRGKTWTAIYGAGRTAAGRRRQSWKGGFQTKKLALEHAQEQEAALRKGSYVTADKHTLGDYLQRWLVDYAGTQTRARTQEDYASIVRKHLTPRIGQVKLQALTTEHIKGLYSGLLADGVSKERIAHVHRLLRAALGHAASAEPPLIARNPALAAKPPKPERKPEMVILSGQQAAAVQQAANATWLGPLVSFAMFAGLRRKEMLGLTWDDVDLTAGRVTVSRTLQRVKGAGLKIQDTKTVRSRRTVALSPGVVTMLRAHRTRQREQRLLLGPLWKEGEWVFTNPDGGPISPDTLTHSFAKLVKGLGLVCRFHDLRHLHASGMLAAGVNVKTISERLGQSTVSITLDVYSHLLPGAQEAAAQAFEQTFGPALANR